MKLMIMWGMILLSERMLGGGILVVVHLCFLFGTVPNSIPKKKIPIYHNYTYTYNTIDPRPV